jgi:N-acetylglucosamine malate deacetylase 1
MDFTPILKSLSSLFQPSPFVKKDPLPFTVMILSPHPDDESITSSLPLRLARENGADIINVAVTLGSKKERQEDRLQELTEACHLLDMELLPLSDNWKQKENELKSLIQKHRPSLILAPHIKDHHPSHIKTGYLLKNALKGLQDMTVLVAWTEFWRPMAKPSLMVEVPLEILQLQMQALEKHRGEVERNPYHLRLPSWMMDNVRRGSELIGGQGSQSAQFAFGILYRLQIYKQGKFASPQVESVLKTDSDIGQIFKLILDAASGSSTKVK